LRSLARFLLRYGLPIQAFTDLSKRAYIEAAQRYLALPDRRMSQSRVALITGLTRKDVARLQSVDVEADDRALARINRAGRVVAGWRRDAEFLNADGSPAALRLDGRTPSFMELVRRYSGDIPARAVLDELTRSGTAVSVDGRVELTSPAVPATEDTEKIALLGTDVADLVETIAHNLQAQSSAPRYQRKVMYDNLSQEAVTEFSRMAAKRSQQLLEEFDRWLARHDRDITGERGGTGRIRAGVGIYFFEEQLQTKEGEGK
jgi:hypothetical protein